MRYFLLLPEMLQFSQMNTGYNRVSVTTNIKNSGLLIRIQDGDEERAQCDENQGRIKGNFVAVFDRTENKSM